jgi:hypothetical protein
MSDKSSWQGLGNLVSGLVGGGKTAKPLPTSTRRCDAGHPMAMDWTECPYCKAAQNSSVQSMRGDDPGQTRFSAPPGGHTATAMQGSTRISQPESSGFTSGPEPMRGGNPSSEPRRTMVLGESSVSNGFTGSGRNASPDSDAHSGRRSTIVRDPSEPSSDEIQRRRMGGRRMTGIVVTFSWSQLGQLFVVREGRNYAGSNIDMIEAQRDTSILVPEDGTLSSPHFLILCQGGKYRISDVNSTNGTYVNGNQIDALGIELVDHARIQAGATLFTFQMVRNPAAVAVTEQRVSSTPTDNEGDEENDFREPPSI